MKTKKLVQLALALIICNVSYAQVCDCPEVNSGAVTVIPISTSSPLSPNDCLWDLSLQNNAACGLLMPSEIRLVYNTPTHPTVTASPGWSVSNIGDTTILKPTVPTATLAAHSSMPVAQVKIPISAAVNYDLTHNHDFDLDGEVDCFRSYPSADFVCTIPGGGTANCPQECYWTILGNSNIDPMVNFMGTQLDVPVVFRANNIERMRIFHNANHPDRAAVGIGIQNPQQELEVYEDIVARGPWPEVAVVSDDGNDASVQFTTSLVSGDLNWQIGIDADDGGYFKIDKSHVTGSNTALTIDTAGNVGIGGICPDPETAKLAVAGTILTQEVVVTEISGCWPDYVFEESYELMPLTELERFINQNHHLPGVVPASEIEENGVNVGETSRVLLEKVEELTLYLIQLQKENDELRSRLANVEDKQKK